MEKKKDVRAQDLVRIERESGWFHGRFVKVGEKAIEIAER